MHRPLDPGGAWPGEGLIVQFFIALVVVVLVCAVVGVLMHIPLGAWLAAGVAYLWFRHGERHG